MPLVHGIMYQGGIYMERLPVGKIIQGLRKAKGVTQEQLSEVLGVSSAAISKWENGQMYPDIGLFPIIARYFNISIDCLFGFSNELSEEEYFSRKHKCVELFESGMCLAGVEKIRNFCRLYPTDDRLKVDLIKSVLPYVALEKNIEIRNTAIHQMILICQECTDDSFQSQKHFLLAHLFMLIGKYEMGDNSLNSKSDFMAIDMKNSLLLREGNSSVIDKIDSTVIILGIQLVYELRNKASYFMRENNLTNALEIFKMQCTLINLLELDSNLYFIIYMNIAYIHCICSQINEALKTIQKFIVLYKDKPIRDNVLIRVLQTGFSSNQFDRVKDTPEFKELKNILKPNGG